MLRPDHILATPRQVDLVPEIIGYCGWKILLPAAVKAPVSAVQTKRLSDDGIRHLRPHFRCLDLPALGLVVLNFLVPVMPHPNRLLTMRMAKHNEPCYQH
jgi:hypothetical protein